MKVYLIVENNKILNFKYECESCIYCQASVSLLSRNAKNQSIEVSNHAKMTEAHDFRYTQNKFTESYIKFAKKYLKFLEKSNVTRNLGRGIKYALLTWPNVKSYIKTRKYFK